MLGALLLAVASSGSAAPKTACRAAPTKAVVTRFLTAFNRGDLRTVDHLFGAVGVFHWYSTTARANGAAGRPTTGRP